ncbi:MAG TPA: hypothetical protein VEU07_01285, partial [Candidatus Acidoferrum sp.]|nr:hypothetical protein [Candidatus Acidoferrum sp.]
MKPKVKGALLLFLAFLLGTACGALGFALLRPHAGWWGTPRDAARFQEMVIRRLTRELDLRPEQRQQVQTILHEAGDQFTRLREEMRPRFIDIRDRTRDRIRVLLDADQQSRFQALMDRW